MRYFSKLEHWLVSRRITPWLSAEPLTPHGIYHLPVVFSLQKPVKKRNIKPHMKGRVQCVKSAQAETTHSTKGSRKSKKQPLWWASKTEKAWREKRAAVENRQKGRSRPNPDPKLQWIPKLSWAFQAHSTGGESLCEELSTKTTLTQFWQFYQQMERKIQLHLQVTCTKDSSGKNKQWLWQSVSRMLTTESSSSCWWTCTSNMESA